MLDNPNIDPLKEHENRYWREFDPNRYPSIKPTTREQNLELRTAFKEEFGEDGIKFVSQLAVSEKLNGGLKPDKDKHFPGMIYSIPISTYFMRRALGEDKDEAYKIFTHDVHTHADAQKVHPRIPRQRHVEDLCYTEMIQLRAADLFKSSFDLAMLPVIEGTQMLADLTQAWASMFSHDPIEEPDQSPESDLTM